MSNEKTLQWFQHAVPNPSSKNQDVQVGCLLEEVVELLDSIDYNEEDISAQGIAREWLDLVALRLKNGQISIKGLKREEFLDALTDIQVTAIGSAHMFGMDPIGALEEVNASNFSKFENDYPVFDENGKIKKGKNYFAPDLGGFV